ncbi:hypothetical protein Ahy_B10g106269 [Arachis hypogaea]|uniref:Zinc knuckle CX2CX4HX4C domain-containing protein n=1 Tax=Arachis hypogaea TaxID=3818 RepID=A0A444XA99_ARAHY|nr:hypothetical protein Ahy_B10g106269 [Arachis hypogaea]
MEILADSVGEKITELKLSYKESFLVTPGLMDKDNNFSNETINEDESNPADRTTCIHSRGCFARICVKIDLSRKMVPRISVLGNTLNIEYEDLHLICFNCRIYGYRSELCGETPAAREDHRAEVAQGKQVVFEGDLEAANHGIQKKITDKLIMDNKSGNNQLSPKFGPSMMVQKFHKRKPEKPQHAKRPFNQIKDLGTSKEGSHSNGNQIMDKGSRFNVLYDDKNEEILEDINACNNEQNSPMPIGPVMESVMNEGGGNRPGPS